MKTLIEVKDEVAQHYGFDNWAYMFQRSDKYVVADCYSEVSARYAKYCAEQALKEAAERMYSVGSQGMTIKQTILSTPIVTP